jgi:hypothetical protein
MYHKCGKILRDLLPPVFGVQSHPAMAFRLSRRAFLAAPLPLFLFPRAIAATSPGLPPFDFVIDVGVLFDMITFALKGTVTEISTPRQVDTG